MRRPHHIKERLPDQEVGTLTIIKPAHFALREIHGDAAYFNKRCANIYRIFAIFDLKSSTP